MTTITAHDAWNALVELEGEEGAYKAVENAQALNPDTRSVIAMLAEVVASDADFCEGFND